jgi:hypothetical protein
MPEGLCQPHISGRLLIHLCVERMDDHPFWELVLGF